MACFDVQGSFYPAYAKAVPHSADGIAVVLIDIFVFGPGIYFN